ncbi:MAG: hypothetical protein RR332_02220, partial [Clostridiales bacterium]
MLFVGLFSLLGAILLTFLTGLFSMKVNRALLIFLSVILVLVYCSQYIYYGLFKTPMLVFSILQAKQVAEFSTTAFQVIGAHIPELLLFFLALAGVLFGF